LRRSLTLIGRFGRDTAMIDIPTFSVAFVGMKSQNAALAKITPAGGGFLTARS
jgi:hypothetical protein